MECLRREDVDFVFLGIDVDDVPGQHARFRDESKVRLGWRKYSRRELVWMIVGDEVDSATVDRLL